MFPRIFIYKLKELSRSYGLIGWNFLFPLVLATAFFLGFSNIIKDDPAGFVTIETGYVAEVPSSAGFYDMLDGLANEDKDDTPVIFLHTYASRGEAEEALRNGDIGGFFLETADGIETIVPSNGFDSTILNEIARGYYNYADVISRIAQDRPEKLAEAVGAVSKDTAFLAEHDFGKNTSQFIQYFYALLAMASLFGSWISTMMLEGMCANMTERGKRVESAPVSKFLNISAGILAGLVFQIASDMFAVIYIEYVLKIDLGLPLGTMALICILGSALGISAGVLMGSLFTSPALRVVVPLLFSMVCSFFSGLMYGNIKQLVQYHCPIVNLLNPAALMTDAMYVRATYGVTAAYREDLIIMCVMIAGCLAVSTLRLRRRRYVSL